MHLLFCKHICLDLDSTAYSVAAKQYVNGTNSELASSWVLAIASPWGFAEPQEENALQTVICAHALRGTRKLTK